MVVRHSFDSSNPRPQGERILFAEQLITTHAGENQPLIKQHTVRGGFYPIALGAGCGRTCRVMVRDKDYLMSRSRMALATASDLEWTWSFS